MELLDILRTNNNADALAELGKRAGLSTSQTEAVLASVLPEISHRVSRNTLSRGGLADLLNLLGSAYHQAFLKDPALAGTDASRAHGKAILGQIIGTKHGSRVIAKRAARETGVPAETIEHMMPEIAALSLGGLQQQTASQFDDIFSKLPQQNGTGVGEQRPLPVPGGGLGGNDWGFDWQPGQPIPPSGPAFPDPGGRNSPAGADGGAFGDQSPLPVPGNAPGRDWGGGGTRRGGGGFRDLSDILRRRGGHIPQQQQGGSLWSVLRQIIASALGFKNNGVVAYIIQFILMRVAWPILRRMVFGR